MDFKKISVFEWILIGGAVLALLYAYKKGAFAGPEKGYKTDEGNATDGSTVTIDDNTAKNRARAFRSSMLDSYASNQIFIDGCNSLLVLSDADLIAVSNAYNNMFVNEEYNTLRSVLAQEWIVYYNSADVKAKLIDRFTKIGI